MRTISLSMKLTAMKKINFRFWRKVEEPLPVQRSVMEFTIDAEDAEVKLAEQAKLKAALAHQQEVLVEMKRGHDRGVHWVGFCPFCPSNRYYD